MQLVHILTTVEFDLQQCIPQNCILADYHMRICISVQQFDWFNIFNQVTAHFWLLRRERHTYCSLYSNVFKDKSSWLVCDILVLLFCFTITIQTKLIKLGRHIDHGSYLSASHVTWISLSWSTDCSIYINFSWICEFLHYHTT